MRWERLFGELEGYAEHLQLEERDALVTELREGEWAERTWSDTLAGDVDAEIAVRDVGVLAGRVRLANDQVIHLESSSAVYVVATSAVHWVRAEGHASVLDRESVAAKLGWGPVFREAQDDGDSVRLTLVGGSVIEGAVSAVGRDFVRISPASGRHRDVPTPAISVATFPR
jgi:hypothetical protein